MVEVMWVSLFGAALAWLQSRSTTEEPQPSTVSLDDEWSRWEREIHDWRET